MQAIQLDIYKRGRGFELGATEKQIQEVVKRDSNPGPLECARPTRCQLGHPACSYISRIQLCHCDTNFFHLTSIKVRLSIDSAIVVLI